MLHQQSHVPGILLKPQASFKPRCYDQPLDCILMTVKTGEGTSKWLKNMIDINIYIDLDKYRMMYTVYTILKICRLDFCIVVNDLFGYRLELCILYCTCEIRSSQKARAQKSNRYDLAASFFFHLLSIFHFIYLCGVQPV